jgi:hypothetical protein
MNSGTSNSAQFKVRMPPALKQKLAAAANKNLRSVGAEIVHRLMGTFVGGKSR